MAEKEAVERRLRARRAEEEVRREVRERLSGEMGGADTRRRPHSSAPEQAAYATGGQFFGTQVA